MNITERGNGINKREEMGANWGPSMVDCHKTNDGHEKRAQNPRQPTQQESERRTATQFAREWGCVKGACGGVESPAVKLIDFEPSGLIR